jgi:tRNA(Ile)-lysidine synthase
MLGETYAAMRRYAMERRLSWITDESNADTRFSRNFVRHKLLPMVEERFPGATQAMARSAGHIAEAQRLLDDLAAIDFAMIRSSNGLDLAKLRLLDDVRAKNVLRFYLSQGGFDIPQSAHLAEFVRQMRSARGDSLMDINLGGVRARCHKDVLCFSEASVVPGNGVEFRWNGDPSWLLPELGGVITVNPTVGRGISASKLAAAPVRARLRVGGEKIRLELARPTRTLKNLLREAGIPHWLRHGLPLIYCGSDLVFVPGIGVAAAYRAGAGEEGLLMEWLQAPF